MIPKPWYMVWRYHILCFISTRSYRWFGLLECSRREGLRFTWLQIVLSPGIGAQINLWRRDNGRWQWGLYLHPLLFRIYLKLWWSKKDWPNKDYSGHLWWGFDWTWRKGDHDLFWFGWPGKARTVHYLPWHWCHIQSWVMTSKDGWEVKDHLDLMRGGEYISPFDDPKVHIEKHPYHYLLKSGVVQERIAAIYGERAEWRWKISKQLGLPWPRMVKTSIQVEFNDEVGERSGSWKGGCIGCSWEWKDGQTMLDALRDMEAKRRFT